MVYRNEALASTLYSPPEHFQPDVHIPEKQLSIELNGKRIQGRPGRMIRKMFPSYEDTRIERLVQRVHDAFFTDTSEWTFQETTYDIDDVYCANVASLPGYPSPYACLESSCMNGRREATQAYNSGDFTCHSLWDEHDQLLARTLAYGTGYGIIYASSKMAGDHLQDHLQNDLNLTEVRTFEGARLCYTTFERAPYLDFDQRGYLDGDFWVIGDGPWLFEQTNGYAEYDDDY